MCLRVCVFLLREARQAARSGESKKAIGNGPNSARDRPFFFFFLWGLRGKKSTARPPARARAPMGPLDRFLVRRVVEAPASDPSLRPSPTTSGQGRAGGGGDGRGGESIESASDVGSLSPVSPLPPPGPPAASPGKHQQLDAPGTTVAPPVRRGALIG